MITSDSCANCGTDLVGEFCHACGQHRLDNPELALAPMVRQFREELIHLDFKTLRTLVALFRPGVLTREYLEGRRRTYLSPLKLYLLSAAIFFIASPLVGFSVYEILAGNENNTLGELVNDRIRQVGISRELFAERFNDRMQTVSTIALSISVVVASLMLRLMFKQRTLGAHIVVSLHYVSFLYVAALGLSAFQKFTGLRSPGVSLAITYAIVIPYLFVMFRRVYQDPPGRTLAKVLLLCSVALLVDSAVNLGAFVLTLWLI